MKEENSTPEAVTTGLGFREDFIEPERELLPENTGTFSEAIEIKPPEILDTTTLTSLALSEGDLELPRVVDAYEGMKRTINDIGSGKFVRGYREWKASDFAHRRIEAIKGLGLQEYSEVVKEMGDGTSYAPDSTEQKILPLFDAYLKAIAKRDDLTTEEMKGYTKAARDAAYVDVATAAMQKVFLNTLDEAGEPGGVRILAERLLSVLPIAQVRTAWQSKIREITGHGDKASWYNTGDTMREIAKWILEGDSIEDVRARTISVTRAAVKGSMVLPGEGVGVGTFTTNLQDFNEALEAALIEVTRGEEGFVSYKTLYNIFGWLGLSAMVPYATIGKQLRNLRELKKLGSIADDLSKGKGAAAVSEEAQLVARALDAESAAKAQGLLEHNSIFSKLPQMSPEDGNLLLAHILTNKPLQEALSIDKASILMAITPKDAYDPNTLLAGATPRMLEIASNITARLAKVKKPSNYYSTTEATIDRTKQIVGSVIKELEGDGVTYWGGHSVTPVAIPSEEVVKFSASYGLNSTKGYSSYKEAFKKGKDLAVKFMKESMVVDRAEVMVWNKGLGILEKAHPKENYPKGTEFFARVTGTKVINPSDTLVTMEDIVPVGKWGRWLWFADPHYKMRGELDKLFTKYPEVHSELQKGLQDIRYYVDKLNWKEKRALTNILAIGEDAGREFSFKDFRAYLGNSLPERQVEDLYGGYLSVRAGFNKLHEIKEAYVRKTLVADGNKTVFVRPAATEKMKRIHKELFGVDEETGLPNAHLEFIGKPIDKSFPEGLSEVIDYERGVVSNISRKSFEEGVKEGKYLVKLHVPVQIGNGRYNYGWVGRSFDLAELPERVLVKRPGYYKHVHTDAYFIKVRTTFKEDGKVVAKGDPNAHTIVGTTDNKKAAEDFLAKKQAEARARGEDPDDWLIYHDKYQDTDISEIKMIKDDFDASSHFWFEKRNAPIKRIGGETSPILDPVNAFFNDLENVARHITIGDLTSKMRSAHQAQFKDLYEITPLGARYVGKEAESSGKWASGLKSGSVLTKEARDYVKRANSFMERIEYYESYKSLPERAWLYLAGKVEDATVRADRWISHLLSKEDFNLLSKGGRLTTKFLQEHPPQKIVTALVAAKSIALNPLKMATLNFATYSSVGAKYGAITATKAYAGMQPLVYLASTLDHVGKLPKGVAEAQAMTTKVAIESLKKLLDYSEEEVIQLVRTFKASGKFEAIDHYVYQSSLANWINSFPTTKTGLAAEAVSGLGKKPVHFFKRIGHDLGEKYHQAGTWIGEVVEWDKMNPTKRYWTNQKYIDDLSYNARKTGIDMTISGAPLYQKGLLAPLFQFVAHHHKMWNMAFTDAYFGKVGPGPLGYLKNPQRAKFVLYNTLLFGVEGLGLNQATEFISEKLTGKRQSIPQLLGIGYDTAGGVPYLMMAGGLVDTTINLGWGYFTGDREHLKVSAQLAAGNSMFFTVPLRLIETFIENPKGLTALEAFLGSAGSRTGAISNYWEVAKVFKNLALNEAYNPDLTQRFMDIGNKVAQLFDPFDAWTKFQIYKYLNEYNEQAGLAPLDYKRGKYGWEGQYVTSDTQQIAKVWFGISNYKEAEKHALDYFQKNRKNMVTKISDNILDIMELSFKQDSPIKIQDLDALLSVVASALTNEPALYQEVVNNLTNLKVLNNPRIEALRDASIKWLTENDQFVAAERIINSWPTSTEDEKKRKEDAYGILKVLPSEIHEGIKVLREHQEEMRKELKSKREN